MCQASREAYAREHGLSAKDMLTKVRWRQMAAETYLWQEAFNRIATFMVVEPPIFRGVFVGDNRANVVYTNLPDGKVAVDTENCPMTVAEANEASRQIAKAADTENQVMEFDTVLKPEEAEVLARLESKRSKVPAAENCPRCGSKLYDGSCGYCCGDPDCEVCV